MAGKRLLLFGTHKFLTHEARRSQRVKRARDGRGKFRMVDHRVGINPEGVAGITFRHPCGRQARPVAMIERKVQALIVFAARMLQQRLFPILQKAQRCVRVFPQLHRSAGHQLRVRSHIHAEEELP